MDNIRDMIKQAFDGDANAFEKNFDGVMAARMTSALETKYDSMFGPNEVEDVAEPEVEVSADPELELETQETED
jgi:hypothetical protein